MSEFKGTKGKWFACCVDKKPHFLFSENGETTICGFHQKKDMSEDLSDEEFRSNAKLIACAPEMLEIIKKFLIEFEYEDATESECILYHEAKQLIKKATE